jgi:hypothetical protein
MSQADTDAQARVSARTYAGSAIKFFLSFGFVEWGLTSLSVIQLAVPAELLLQLYRDCCKAHKS